MCIEWKRQGSIQDMDSDRYFLKTVDQSLKIGEKITHKMKLDKKVVTRKIIST